MIHIAWERRRVIEKILDFVSAYDKYVCDASRLNINKICGGGGVELLDPDPFPLQTNMYNLLKNREIY